MEREEHGTYQNFHVLRIQLSKVILQTISVQGRQVLIRKRNSTPTITYT